MSAARRARAGWRRPSCPRWRRRSPLCRACNCAASWRFPRRPPNSLRSVPRSGRCMNCLMRCERAAMRSTPCRWACRPIWTQPFWKAQRSCESARHSLAKGLRKMHKVSFIGGGNMAAAIIGGLIASGSQPTDIEVVEINADARAQLSARFGVVTHTDLSQARLHPLVVLAVKPQTLPEVAAALASRLAGHLVISIAAGVRLADLARWLGGHRRIVRAMPNTPALVQAGIAGLYAPPDVDQDARSQAEAVLRAVGGVVWVEDESRLDAGTAVSGSGPAYVFYFIESLEAAAVAQGLPVTTARQLALQTFFGAAKLALESGEEPAVLRQRVTSKGGTTERGIAALETAAVKAGIGQAVEAASLRSAELGDELGRLA